MSKKGNTINWGKAYGSSHWGITPKEAVEEAKEEIKETKKSTIDKVLNIIGLQLKTK